VYDAASRNDTLCRTDRQTAAKNCGRAAATPFEPFLYAPPERSEHNPSTQPAALAALLFLNLRRQQPPHPLNPFEPYFPHGKPFTMLIDTLEYSPPPWYTMTTAPMQKKVTIEQYERLYFFSQLKETSR